MLELVEASFKRLALRVDPGLRGPALDLLISLAMDTGREYSLNMSLSHFGGNKRSLENSAEAYLPHVMLCSCKNSYKCTKILFRPGAVI